MDFTSLVPEGSRTSREGNETNRRTYSGRPAYIITKHWNATVLYFLLFYSGTETGNETPGFHQQNELFKTVWELIMFFSNPIWTCNFLHVLFFPGRKGGILFNLHSRENGKWKFSGWRKTQTLSVVLYIHLLEIGK